MAAVPIKLRPTLLELLVGNILSGSGHVTDAILTVLAKTSWTNYFKPLQSNGFSWLSLCRQWLELVLRYFPRLTITLIIDDMLTPRASKKAPSEHYITIMPTDPTGRLSSSANYGWPSHWC